MPEPQADFDRRVEAAKLAAMAEFAAGAGHEINNPLAVIAGRAQLLLEDETHPQRRHELAVIHTQAMRVYEMIADMMLFARPPAPRIAPCDLASLVRKVADELALAAKERRVALHLTIGDAPSITADATQIAVVLRAICENALAAAPHGGRVAIRLATAAHVDPTQDGVLLAISDDGPGMDSSVREHIFDPFYSGRQAGRGLGMGLAKAWRIVELHGGRIDVVGGEGRGATFTITLPARR